MEIFASSKSMLQVKMLEVIQNRFSGLLLYRSAGILNLSENQLMTMIERYFIK